MLPVYAGEMQVRCLGADIQSLDDHGKSLTDEDHRRLIEEALSEVDFSELAGTEGNGR